MTVCVGGKRAKIWTRYNLQRVLSKTEVVTKFFSEIRVLNGQIQAALLEIYNKKLSVFQNSLTKEYQILIRMLSTNDKSVRELAAGAFASDASIVPDSGQPKASRFDPAPEKRDEVLSIICREFGDSGEPKSGSGRPKPSQKFVAFAYPSNSSRSEESAEPERQALPGSDFNAISVVNISHEGTEIIGLAYEQQPPENFRRSATHIVSGEISVELGSAY
jgi:hypothetical protein